MDIEKMWFETIADTGQVGGHRGRFDMMRHKDNKKAKGVGGGVNRKVVDLAEIEI
jgi:hypothetical protein